MAEKENRQDLDFKRYLRSSVDNIKDKVSDMGSFEDVKNSIDESSAKSVEYQKAQQKIAEKQLAEQSARQLKTDKILNGVKASFGTFAKDQANVIGGVIGETFSEWAGPELNKAFDLTKQFAGSLKSSFISMSGFLRDLDDDESINATRDATESIENVDDSISSLVDINEKTAKDFNKFDLLRTSSDELKEEIKNLTKKISTGKLHEGNTEGDVNVPIIYGSLDALTPSQTTGKPDIKESIDKIRDGFSDLVKGQKEQQQQEKRMADLERKRSLRRWAEEKASKSKILNMILFVVGLFVGAVVMFGKILYKSFVLPLKSLLIPLKAVRSMFVSLSKIKIIDNLRNLIKNSKIGQTISRFTTTISSNISALKLSLLGIIERIKGSGFGKIVTNVLSAIKKPFTHLSKIMKGIGSILKAFPGFNLGTKLGKFIPFVGMLLSIKDFIVGFTENEGPLLSKLQSGIEKVFEGFFKLPAKMLGWAIDKVLDLFDLSIEGGAGAAIWKTISQTFKTTMNLFFGFWESIWDIITISGRLIKEAASKVYNLLFGKKEETDEISSSILPAIGDSFLWIVDNILKPIGKAIKFVVDKIGSILGTIKDKIEWLSAPLAEGETMWGRIWSPVENIMDTFFGWIDNLVGKIKGVFDSGIKLIKKAISLIPGIDIGEEKTAEELENKRLEKEKEKEKQVRDMNKRLMKHSYANIMDPIPYHNVLKETRARPAIDPVQKRMSNFIEDTVSGINLIKIRSRRYKEEMDRKEREDNRRMMEKSLTEAKNMSNSINVMNQSISSMPQQPAADHTELMTGSVSDLALMSIFY